MILPLLLAATAVATETPPLTLERAIAIALEHNSEQVGRELQVQSAKEDERLAASAILPRIDFNASLGGARVGAGDAVVNDVAIPQSTRYFATSGAGVGVRQLLFNGGRWQSDLAVARTSVASGEAAVREQRLQTTYLVEVGFFELIRAQRQLSVLEETAARSRDQALFAQKLFDAGRASQADVYAARANRDSDELNRIGQQARVEAARQDLAVALGLDGALPPVVEPPALLAPPPAPPSLEDATRQALEHRPSLEALSLAVRAQHTRVEGAGADNWPSVVVSGSYGRSTTGLDTFTEPPDRNSQLSAGLGLSWNLFSGFATRAQVDKARVAVLQAENDLAGARRQVAADVQKARARLTAALEQLRMAQDAEDNAREALRLAKVRQELGSGTQLEVRDGELRLTQAQLARLGALVDGHEAWAALRRATGPAHE